MAKRSLYTVAMLALKPDPQPIITQEGGGEVTILWRAGESEEQRNTIHLMSSVTTAGSFEEARDWGLNQILEQCPKAEGWVGHTVQATRVERTAIKQALDGADPDSEEETADEFLM